MSKAIILEKIEDINYRELNKNDVYQPTREEEILHGTRVVTRQIGDPNEDEVETEALLGAVCTHEVSLYLGDLTHPRYPMIPGHEAVHRVIRVGKNVRHVKEGDLASCCWYMGQWSKKVIGPSDLVYKIPENNGDLAKWIVEPAASIVNAVSHMTIMPGSKVLLIGIGFMGLLMTQLVARYPLAKFVAADIKSTNLAMALRFGAETVLNPQHEDEMEVLRRFGEEYFDIVIECSGSQDGLDLAVKYCRTAGYIYLFGWHRKRRSIDFLLGHLRGHQIIHTSPAVDEGRRYERYWPVTIELINKGIFNLIPLVTHRYKAYEIKKCMEDSVARPDGFIKSVFEFD